MNRYVGMDAAEIRELARLMMAKSQELQSLIASTTAQVDGLDWKGPDRERFVQDWHGSHVASLSNAVARLQAAAGEAMRSAEAQEWASRAH